MVPLKGFSARFNGVMQAARRIADQCGSLQLATEHLVLGLLNEDDGILPHVLTTLGIDPNKIRSEISSEGENRHRRSASSGVLPITDKVSDVLAKAEQYAHRVNQPQNGVVFIGTDSLIAGLLMTPCFGGNVLLRNGLSVIKVQSIVQALASQPQPQPQTEQLGTHREKVKAAKAEDKKDGIELVRVLKHPIISDEDAQKFWMNTYWHFLETSGAIKAADVALAECAQRFGGTAEVRMGKVPMAEKEGPKEGEGPIPDPGHHTRGFPGFTTVPENEKAA